MECHVEWDISSLMEEILRMHYNITTSSSDLLFHSFLTSVVVYPQNWQIYISAVETISSH
jgi:hypothetical protein